MGNIDLTKRYWLFLWDEYYPRGGLFDLHSTYDDIGEVEAMFSKMLESVYDYGQILDTERKVIIRGETK